MSARAASDPGDSITFERYAEVSAYLRRFPAANRDEVIARLGIRRRTWAAANEKWSRAREAELASGKADLSARFGVIFTRAKERLARERVTLEAIGPLPGPDDVAPEALASPPAPAPSPVEVAPLPPAPAPVIQRISADLAPPPQAPAPSFLVGLVGLVGRPPSPSTPPPPMVPIAPSQMPARVVAPQMLQSTLPLGASLPVPSLPFAGSVAPADSALSSARRHAEAVQGPAPRSNILGGTVGVAAPSATPALPFHGRPSAGSRPPPAGAPDLTVVQYASLRVEIQLRPADEAGILLRYGVGSGARAALDALWRDRFEADPMSRMEFARAYAQYTAWLRSNPR